MKKLIVLFLLSLTFSFASPISENGALSFNDEGRIVNEKGNVVQLRGMSLFWDTWASGWFNENVVKTLASTNSSTGWNASLVRAPIANRDLNLAKNMMDWAYSAGIYVIIDNHSHCAHKETSATATYFENVAAYVKQKGYKHVIYELYNEPLYENCSGATDTYSSGTLTSWATIKSYAEAIIPKIRANDANGLILVGTPRYSQDILSAQKNPITGYKNVGYVLHFYASEPGHAGLKTSLFRARCQNFPVFITEWGTSPASGDGTLDWSAINTWMAWIEKLGYSWANWSVYDKNETASAIASGGSSGYWTESQLTASGKFVRKMMQGFGNGGSITAMGLTEPSLQNCSIFDEGSTFEFVRDGEGYFKKAINAENYSDSSNIESIQDLSAHAYQDIYIITTGTEGAWTKYKMNDVPETGFYRMAFVYKAPNKDIEISYTVEGIDKKETLHLPQTTNTTTFTVNSSMIKLKEGLSNIKFDLGGISPSDLLFDAFWATTMDSTDSIKFGLLEIDEEGKRIVKADTSIKEDNTPIFAKSSIKAPSLSVHGRILEFSKPLNNTSLSIFDPQGRLIKSKLIDGGAVIDLSNFQSGTYILQLKGVGISLTKKIQLK